MKAVLFVWSFAALLMMTAGQSAPQIPAPGQGQQVQQSQTLTPQQQQVVQAQTQTQQQQQAPLLPNGVQQAQAQTSAQQQTTTTTTTTQQSAPAVRPLPGQQQQNATAANVTVTPQKPPMLFPENEILREATKEIAIIENNDPNMGPVLLRTQRLEKYRALKERVLAQFQYINNFVNLNQKFVTDINATHQVNLFRAGEAQERLRLLSEAMANLQQVIKETQRRVDEEQRIDLHNRVFLEYNGTRTRT